MADVNSQTWTSYHGSDVLIELLGPVGEDPTGWDLAFTCAKYPQESPPTLTVTSPTVAVSGPDSDGRYTITIPLTRSQTGVTLSEDSYAADLWRTDTGNEYRLAGGTLALTPPVRLQV